MHLQMVYNFSNTLVVTSSTPKFIEPPIHCRISISSFSSTLIERGHANHHLLTSSQVNNACVSVSSFKPHLGQQGSRLIPDTNPQNWISNFCIKTQRNESKVKIKFKRMETLGMKNNTTIHDELMRLKED